jgi:sugar phosphate isomerase/epimerase
MAAELGVKRISLDSVTLKKAVEDPEFAPVVKKAAELHNIQILDVHAPHGLGDSLGNPLPGGLERSNAVMLDSLRAAAEVGAKIVTMHTARTRLVNRFAPEAGPIENVDLDGAVDRAVSQLEVLIPEAEKLGLMIAIENLFLPSSTASHLNRIMEKARHANLGFCYDSGHALIVEKIPGKTPDMITDWIAWGWENDTMTFQDDQLDLMLNDVITTHFHDNDGNGDLHRLPGTGVADWKRIAERMRKAPRLLSVQSEVGKSAFAENIKEYIQKFAAAGFTLTGE